MRLCTPAQMKDIERLTEVEFFAGGETLMESAGALAAKEIQMSFLPELSRGRVAVLCGPGNNGGDGLVIARHLHSQGYLALEVFIVGDSKSRSPLFKVQKARAEKHGITIHDLEKKPELVESLRSCNLIIDALYGIGISRDIVGVGRQVIEAVSATPAQIVAVDIPSGLCGLTGKIYGAAVKANMTITFGLAKPGLVVGDGPECSGKIRIVQIGFPRRLFREVAKTHFTFHERLARRWLPVRKKDSNKAKNGHLLVVAGQPGLWGAAAMACESAYRMGAGYVTLAAPSKVDINQFLGAEVGAEALTVSRDSANVFEKKTAVLVGPGAGADENLKSFLEKLIREKPAPVIADADALTVLSKMKGVKLPPSWILTPHAGELSRLLGVTAAEIEGNRFYFATLAAKKFGCFVLLKGYRTVIASAEERVAVVMSGNAALAKAGTGDVLSGMIGALLAQGLGPVQAAGTAAYLHGRTADDWVRCGKDMKSFMPRDIVAAIPDVLTQVARE